jgi:hypothetical protein
MDDDTTLDDLQEKLLREKRRKLLMARTDLEIEKTKISLDELTRASTNKPPKSVSNAVSGAKSIAQEHPAQPNPKLDFIHKALEIGFIPKPLGPNSVNASDSELVASYYTKKLIATLVGMEATSDKPSDKINLVYDLVKQGYGITPEEARLSVWLKSITNSGLQDRNQPSLKHPENMWSLRTQLRPES